MTETEARAAGYIRTPADILEDIAALEAEHGPPSLRVTFAAVEVVFERAPGLDLWRAIEEPESPPAVAVETPASRCESVACERIEAAKTVEDMVIALAGAGHLELAALVADVSERRGTSSIDGPTPGDTSCADAMDARTKRRTARSAIEPPPGVMEYEESIAARRRGEAPRERTREAFVAGTTPVVPLGKIDPERQCPPPFGSMVTTLTQSGAIVTRVEWLDADGPWSIEVRGLAGEETLAEADEGDRWSRDAAEVRA